jgi:tRNA 2-thiouridine synthesizing protein D
LCDSPFQHESAEQAYEIAQAALRKGHRVNIFLMMDGVYNPVTSQSGKPFNMQSISEKLIDLIKSGVRIIACRVCMEVRGVKEEMFPEGLDIGGIFDLSEMIADSDVVINFIERI